MFLTYTSDFHLFVKKINKNTKRYYRTLLDMSIKYRYVVPEIFLFGGL
jgi:hypothetical protein